MKLRFFHYLYYYYPILIRFRKLSSLLILYPAAEAHLLPRVNWQFNSSTYHRNNIKTSTVSQTEQGHEDECKKPQRLYSSHATSTHYSFVLPFRSSSPAPPRPDDCQKLVFWPSSSFCSCCLLTSRSAAAAAAAVYLSFHERLSQARTQRG